MFKNDDNTRQEIIKLKQIAGEEAINFAYQTEKEWICVCGSHNLLNENQIQNCSNCHMNRDFALENYSQLKCPACGMVNPRSAQRCDCGYIFLPADKARIQEKIYERRKERYLSRSDQLMLLIVFLGFLFFMVFLIVSALIKFIFESPSVIIIIGPIVFLFLKLLWDSWRAYNSQLWDVTEGIIATAELEERRGAGQIKTKAYILKIQYKYSVDNITYYSKRIVYGNNCLFSPSEYKEYLNIGNPVKVYYKPSNPKIAVLRPGFNKEYTVEAFLFIFLILIYPFIFGLILLYLDVL